MLLRGSHVASGASFAPLNRAIAAQGGFRFFVASKIGYRTIFLNSDPRILERSFQKFSLEGIKVLLKFLMHVLLVCI